MLSVVVMGLAEGVADQQQPRNNAQILSTIKASVKPNDRKLMFGFFNPYMAHSYNPMINPMMNPMMNPGMMMNPMMNSMMNPMMMMYNPLFSMMGMMNMFNGPLYNGMNNWIQNNTNNGAPNQQVTKRKLFADDISQLNLPGELPPMMQQDINKAEAKSQNDLNRQLAALEGIDSKEHEGFSDYLGQVIASDPRL